MARVNGWEHLDRALEKGEGVLVVGTHLGNWDLAGALMIARGYSLAAVAENLSNPYIDRWAWRVREMRGIQLMSMGEAPLKIYRALGHNRVVAVVTDRPLYADGVPILLFGAETRWPKGVAALALRTGAQVVTGYLVRDRDGAFTAEVVPIEYQRTGDRESDIQRLTQKVAEVQEGFIRRYPDQWYMFRRMWPGDQ
jgi:lauroyl/myristoyl acyltransferase